MKPSRATWLKAALNPLLITGSFYALLKLGYFERVPLLLAAWLIFVASYSSSINAAYAAMHECREYMKEKTKDG